MYSEKNSNLIWRKIYLKSVIPKKIIYREDLVALSGAAFYVKEVLRMRGTYIISKN